MSGLIGRGLPRPFLLEDARMETVSNKDLAAMLADALAGNAEVVPVVTDAMKEAGHEEAAVKLARLLELADLGRGHLENRRAAVAELEASFGDYGPSGVSELESWAAEQEAVGCYETVLRLMGESPEGDQTEVK